MNPVSLPGLSASGRLVFELVIPRGAEVVGTYGSDFYAGTPAVTRHRYGGGHAWYVGTALDQSGVDWVVRQVLAEYGLAGPYPDQPDVETTVRVGPDGVRFRFLLNHGAAEVHLTASVAGVDLLTGVTIRCGQPLTLAPRGVLVVRED